VAACDVDHDSPAQSRSLSAERCGSYGGLLCGYLWQSVRLRDDVQKLLGEEERFIDILPLLLYTHLNQEYKKERLRNIL
jgi:hypothetical protein